jgi:hypothetical protein
LSLSIFAPRAGVLDELVLVHRKGGNLVRAAVGLVANDPSGGPFSSDVG